MKIEIMISIVGAIISIIALIKSFNTDRKTHNFAQGQIEIQVREMISQKKTRYADLGIQLEGNPENASLKNAINAALEEVLNAYDEACSKYIDNKIDRIRFKKSYVQEIRNIVEDSNTKGYYLPPVSRYKATLIVYEEWNNLEK